MGEHAALEPNDRMALDRLEAEYQVLAGAVRRLTVLLEAPSDKVALKSELTELKARVGGLRAEIKDIEDRLSA